MLALPGDGKGGLSMGRCVDPGVGSILSAGLLDNPAGGGWDA